MTLYTSRPQLQREKNQEVRGCTADFVCERNRDVFASLARPEDWNESEFRSRLISSSYIIIIVSSIITKSPASTVNRRMWLREPFVKSLMLRQTHVASDSDAT